MTEQVSLCAVGDIHYDRLEPESMFTYVSHILQEADITFGQLENALSLRGEPLPSVRSPKRAHPRVAKALKSAGFDVLSLAGNHVLDYGVTALFDTIECVKAQGITIIGVGKDLEEARKPAIIERKGTRVAFLSYNSILRPGYEARSGKPGCVPLRVWTSYQPIESFQPGTPCQILTFANQEDLAAMREDIRKVRPLADVVVVSMHWGLHFVPAILAMYQREVGHAAIDAGADLILGHHAHILKPIEVYKGRVIFYSLANIATEIPEQAMRVSRKHPEVVILWKVYKRKIYPEYPTYPFPVDSRKTIIAKCLISNRRIEKVSFLPAIINKRAEPEIVSRENENFDRIVAYMEKIDKHEQIDTRYSVERNEVIISGIQ